jgi:hypothetical protein
MPARRGVAGSRPARGDEGPAARAGPSLQSRKARRRRSARLRLAFARYLTVAARCSVFFGLGLAASMALRCAMCSSIQIVIGLAMYQVE